jgi:taurine transport system permease protein
VLNALFDVMKEGFTGVGFWEHIWISTLRVFGAFVLACVIGIPLGIAMGMSPVARGIFDPPIEFYRPIPPLAYLPLMIIWFGIDELSKVLLIFSSVLAPMVLGARAGVKSAAIEQIHAAYSFGATRWQVIRLVVLPSAMPEIFTAMRVGIGFGWTTLVAAEMVAATSGLGYMVLSASRFLQTPIVIMGIVVIAAIAYAFDHLVRFVERRVVPHLCAGPPTGNCIAHAPVVVYLALYRGSRGTVPDTVPSTAAGLPQPGSQTIPKLQQTSENKQTEHL